MSQSMGHRSTLPTPRTTSSTKCDFYAITVGRYSIRQPVHVLRSDCLSPRVSVRLRSRARSAGRLTTAASKHASYTSSSARTGRGTCNFICFAPSSDARTLRSTAHHLWTVHSPGSLCAALDGTLGMPATAFGYFTLFQNTFRIHGLSIPASRSPTTTTPVWPADPTRNLTPRTRGLQPLQRTTVHNAAAVHPTGAVRNSTPASSPA